MPKDQQQQGSNRQNMGNPSPQQERDPLRQEQGRGQASGGRQPGGQPGGQQGGQKQDWNRQPSGGQGSGEDPDERGGQGRRDI